MDILKRLKDGFNGFAGRTEELQQQTPDVGSELAWADPLRLFDSNSFTPFNPSALVTRQGLSIFDKMKLDDQVKASLEFKKHAILSTGWEINAPSGQPDDWEVARFVEHNLMEVKGTLEEALLGVLTFLEYGYSISEKIYNVIEEGEFKGLIGLGDIKDKKPHSFDFRVDKFGNLEGIVQVQTDKIAPLPPEKFIIYTHEKEFGNWYGRSDLEAAYRGWWSKTNVYQWFLMYLERQGVPPMFALYDPNAYSKTQKDDLKKVITTMQAATAGILPRPSRPEAKAQDVLDFWTPELSKQAQQVFIPALNMFNKDISKALLMPGLLGFTPDEGVGSLARAKKHFDVFLMIIEYLRTRIEKRVMQEQIIKPLVDFNYSNIEKYPTFKFLPITDEVRADLLDRWIAAVDKGVVKSEQRDEEHIRSILKFPEIDEKERAQNELDEKEEEEENNKVTPPNDDPASSASRITPVNTTSVNNSEEHFEATSLPDVEGAVEFKEINRVLDKMELEVKERLQATLASSRDALIAFVGNNEDSLSRKINDLRLKGVGEIQSDIREFLRNVFEVGRSTMEKELRKTLPIEALSSVRFAEAPSFAPREALNWLSNKAVISSNLLKDDVLARVKKEILGGIERGDGTRLIQENIRESFKRYLGDKAITNAGIPISDALLETTVRTISTSALSQGRLVQARRVEKFIQGVRFSAILDTRTTDVCTHLDGKLFKMGDPNIDKLSPPRHFSCRSTWVAVPIGITVEQSDFISPTQTAKGFELSGRGFVGASVKPIVPTKPII